MKTVLNILFALFFMSCANNTQITHKDFKSFINKDTDYKAIVEKFGEPDRDVGSGIHIYVYELSDSTEVWIGYTDKMMYAKHYDKAHNLLNTLYDIAE